MVKLKLHADDPDLTGLDELPAQLMHETRRQPPPRRRHYAHHDERGNHLNRSPPSPVRLMVHRVYLVGGPARVGKSSLAQQLLRSDGIAWLPTDVLRTVLRRVLPQLDDLDQGDVSAAAVSELMYPHIEQAVEVCGEEADRFLIEGPDIVPSTVPRLAAALPAITIRACFLGNIGFSGNDLASYRGPKPQHGGARQAELDATAAWIRRESNYYRRECARLGLPYVDVGDLGFDTAMTEARRHLLT